jgi:hypothetical protein
MCWVQSFDLLPPENRLSARWENSPKSHQRAEKFFPHRA